LRQLAEIIDLGSLSLAAKSLNVTQPTLSRNIKSLEAAIGAPVLQRGRYGVTPITIGAALAREGRLIRDALRQAHLDLGHWKGGFAGRLKIGVGTMLAHSLMPQFLAQQARWNVALRIDVQGPDRLVDRVRSRDLDAAVVQIEPYFPKEGLKQLSLFDDKRSYYAGARHPLAQRKDVTDKDISRALQVTVGAFYERRATVVGGSGANGYGGPALELSGDVSIALHLLATGAYIAALPEFVMRHLCDDRRFVRLPYRGQMPSRTLSIWHREDMGGHPLIKEFCRRFSGYVAALRAKDHDGVTTQIALQPAGGSRERSRKRGRSITATD
jgi:DNA-binding transcriptional LysR family regulator